MNAKKRPQKSRRSPASPEAPAAGDRLFESIVARLSTNPQVSQSKMFGSVGLKIDGKVFAMLVKGKLVVKLPRDQVAALIAAGKGEHFDPGHGRLMKEWIAVPPGSTTSWFKLATQARDFVASPG